MAYHIRNETKYSGGVMTLPEKVMFEALTKIINLDPGLWITAQKIAQGAIDKVTSLDTAGG